MPTGYFAQITDGAVTDVRRVDQAFMAENPALYPGLWVEVTSMDQYPAIGWAWTAGGGFTPPDDPEGGAA